MIDLARYPIADLSSDEGLHFANRCREEFLQSGLCELQGFVQQVALDRLVAEARTVADKAYFCRSSHNAYLTDESPNDQDSSNAARNQMERTVVGSVAYDDLPVNGLLVALYQWDPLMHFIGHVLGKNEFHRFADPLGACSINVFTEGGLHGWHFDESEFTVTLMLQSPERGGDFEYVPKIRGLDAESEIVRDVLDGDRSKVVQLGFSPGTLLIFGGRETIHRVTRVSGETPRLVPVLCYSETPDQVNSEHVRKLFWGRDVSR